MATTMYTIHQVGTPKLAFRNMPNYWESLWWNNEQGWVDKQSADYFTPEERHTLNLPMDGEWVMVFVNEPVGTEN